MKLSLLTTATLCSAALAMGLAPTFTNAADPPVQEQAEQAQGPAVKETAFLGIETRPLAADTRAALDLKPGTGLAVRHVGPGTPADEAGLLPGDVLVRLDDQLLINGQQLAVLVRTFDPGDAVTLHVLRDGEAIELNATLAGRVATPQPMIERMPMPRLGDLDALFEQLRGPGLDPFGPDADPRDILDQMQRRMFEQRQEIQQKMDQMRGQLGQAEMQSTIAINDGEHAMTLKANGQDKHLTIKNRGGELIFDGQVPQDGQIEGLPPDVQKKVDDLLKNNRIELHMPRPKQAPREPLPIA